MSRTRRTEPSSVCWMRFPRNRRAKREIESSADAIRSEGYTPVKQRRAIPPDDWDDLPISYTRGQAWSHNKYR